MRYRGRTRLEDTRPRAIESGTKIMSIKKIESIDGNSPFAVTIRSA
jgi:hypothetical protein